ncbi:hypothetical protein DEU56DRAFT_211590 [Suillus clintonianus]|uniref:uncharacterized protein n=1 Tax=Suillus clintonianus TaxID=1904413 RepID=UPI001B86AE76|nr:uncharacterized protein DEU56DRAFT_211590 [Suillus clintonianus]KAG2111754.1 hypothetical protein DEU56DRAFT_211590 [Suillus clintonianus]
MTTSLSLSSPTPSPLNHMRVYTCTLKPYPCRCQPRHPFAPHLQAPPQQPPATAIEPSRCHPRPWATSCAFDGGNFLQPLITHTDSPNQDPSCRRLAPNQDLPRAPANLTLPPRFTALSHCSLRSPAPSCYSRTAACFLRRLMISPRPPAISRYSGTYSMASRGTLLLLIFFIYFPVHYPYLYNPYDSSSTLLYIKG